MCKYVQNVQNAHVLIIWLIFKIKSLKSIVFLLLEKHDFLPQVLQIDILKS